MLPTTIESGLFVFFSFSYAVTFYINLYLHQKKYAHIKHISYDIHHDGAVGKFNAFILRSPIVFFILWAIFTIFLNWLLTQVDIWDFQQFFFGAIIATFAMISGSTVSGMIIFKHIVNNPEEISGKEFLKSRKLAVLNQLAAIIPATLILVPIYIVHETVFILGALCGTILQCFLLLLMAIRTK